MTEKMPNDSKSVFSGILAFSTVAGAISENDVVAVLISCDGT